VAVALDARDGKLATDGWVGQSGTSAVAAATRLAGVGVGLFIHTDISRDGKLSGPNLGSLRELIEAVDAGVIASGGVTSLADVRAAAAAGARGAIIGRALYDRRIDLRQAIAAARGEVPV
jgi:phosphoribosylformimino-5-aminoimidazole carboxamide ribotide isomerase